MTKRRQEERPTHGATEGADTLLGQLQRGLGRGYLAVARGGQGRDQLLRCVLHDPRCDRQLEERAAYYAKLAIVLRLDVSPLAQAVRTNPSESPGGELAASVLMEMAVRGRDDALMALRDALCDQGWLTALGALHHAELAYGRTLVTEHDVRSLARRDDDELEVLVAASYPLGEWSAWEPRLRKLLERAHSTDEPASRRPPRKPDTAMSTLELLQIAGSEPRSSVKLARVLARRADPQSVAAMLEAAAGTDRHQRLVAYRALGSQAHAGLLESVAELLEQDWPDAFDPAMLKYLEALPPEQTLPRARAWLSAGRRARIVGEHILALHARPEDRDVVEATLASALTEGAVYRACSMVEALGTIGDSRSSDLLAHTFESTPYAYARPLVLEALAACQAEALARLATEALWDCERHARQLGAELAPSGALVGARLDELRDDEFEPEEVRSVARTRRL